MKKQIEQVYEIKAPVEKVWQALIDPEIIDQWGGGPAKMDDKVGTEFSLWGGDIFGKNIEVIVNKKLVQEWYSEKGWPKPSIAEFKLEKTDDGTKLTLAHSDIPDNREDEFAGGWEDFYLGPMKEMLENIKG